MTIICVHFAQSITIRSAHTHTSESVFRFVNFLSVERVFVSFHLAAFLRKRQNTNSSAGHKAHFAFEWRGIKASSFSYSYLLCHKKKWQNSSISTKYAKYDRYWARILWLDVRYATPDPGSEYFVFLIRTESVVAAQIPRQRYSKRIVGHMRQQFGPNSLVLSRKLWKCKNTNSHTNGKWSARAAFIQKKCLCILNR